MSSFPLLCERAGTAYPLAISSLRQVQFLAKIENGGWPVLNAAESTLHRLRVPRPSSARGETAERT
jgi:hypothetical protein